MRPRWRRRPLTPTATPSCNDRACLHERSAAHMSCYANKSELCVVLRPHSEHASAFSSRYSVILLARSARLAHAPAAPAGGVAMEAAAAAAKEQQRLQQTFLRAASMGLLADVEQLVAQGVSVAAVVRRAGGARAAPHS